MMKKLICFTVLAGYSALALPLDPLPGNPVPFRYTAYPEASGALYTNPAGFPWLKYQDMTLTWSYTDSTWEGFDGLAFQSAGGGMAGWWEDRMSLRRFDTGAGVMTGDHFSLGAGYSWFHPTVSGHPLEKAGFFSLGALYRPSTTISAGLSWRSGVKDHHRHMSAGIALRPRGSLFTVTGDWAWSRFDVGDGNWQAGLEIAPLPGFTFRGSYSEDRFTAGIQFDYRHLRTRASSGWEGSTSTGGAGSVTVLNRYSNGMLNPTGRFIEYRADNSSELPTRRFLGPRTPSFSEQMVLLRRAAHDPAVPGLLVDFSGFSLNAAQSEELRETMVRFREAGKPVYAYMEYGGTSSFYGASAAARIAMHPAGQLNVSGFTSYTPFFRGFLDRLGIFPDLMHIGEYKNASDILTRTEMTEAHREATRGLLESARQEVARGLSEGRGYEPGQIRALFEGSPYWSRRAREMSLVDTLLYRDQFHDFVRDDLNRSFSVMTPEGYEATIPPSDHWLHDRKVAVVVATGNIVKGESGSSLLGATMGSDTIIRLMERAAATRGVRAIVLRIDSGGGDAMASDDMHRAVERIRERMPVVVSMGSVAASGGYYMACGADAIFADRLTVTGSIGIISGKFVFGRLLENIGINVEAVRVQPSGSPGNPFEPFTEDEWERQFQAMRGGYDLFVSTVARGRNMTFEEVDAIAEGRVWSGSDALELGLVDHNGGVADAVLHAARLGGISPGVPEIVVFPEPPALGRISTGLPSLSRIAGHPLMTGGGFIYLGEGLN